VRASVGGGEEILAQYELMYIVRPDVDEERLDAVVGRVSKFVEQSGGTEEKVDRWGRRRLAYPIKRYDDGIYVVVTFSGAGTIANELTRLLNIDDDILRSIVVRTDAE
jgi:small subunit ribosomal protein S6